MTTFFTGEIIADKHPFLTRKWDADQDIDKKHWGKFGAFAHVSGQLSILDGKFQLLNSQFARDFNADDFNYSRLADSDNVFMRWKEQFLVPDHNVHRFTKIKIKNLNYAGS
jgi:hypothetical protein